MPAGGHVTWRSCLEEAALYFCIIYIHQVAFKQHVSKEGLAVYLYEKLEVDFLHEENFPCKLSGINYTSDSAL